MKTIVTSIYTWLIVGFITCVVLLSFAAVNRNEDRNARTENGEHVFLTFTPSTISQIYRDEWRVRPRKISGQLTLPLGKGPFPAVILYHGHYHPEDLETWFQQLVPRLVETGIATFVVDSFTGREIDNTAFNEARLSRAARLTDIFQALKFLAGLDEIDENKIGISAYSVGGTTAILAADRRVNETSLAGGRSFAALLPVYPTCQVRFRNPELIGSPMLVLVAGNDDYSPSSYCVQYLEEAAFAGYNVKINIYEKAKHGWINEKASTDCENCMSFRDCGLMYIEDSGHESALDGSVSTLFGWQEYLESVYRNCGTIGVISRFNEVISKDTLETTVGFFSGTLKRGK